MSRAKTSLVALCTLVLGVACTRPAREEAAREAPKPTLRRALGEGPAALVADLGVKAEGAVVRYPSQLVAAGSTLLFAATEDTTGTELWRLDSTGPRLVADLVPGPLASSPSNLFHLRGLTYFTATDAQHGMELWRTDGTTRGTVRVKDLRPGPTGALPQNFAEYNGWLFFMADDGEHGFELWRTDGTPEGTVLVRDIVLGSGGSSPSSFTVFDGRLYFVATVAGKRQLWRTDGTALGTVRVSSKVTVNGSGTPGPLVPAGNALFFSGSDGATGYELWKTDGTDAGTVRVKDIWPGASDSAPQRLAAFGDALYFTATDGVSGRELWRSDGTDAGTGRVVELVPGNNTAELTEPLVAAGNRLFFTLHPGTDAASPLYATDGTAAGTVKLLGSESLVGRGPSQLTALGGTLYFTATGTTGGPELWTSDGTPSGTRPLGDDLIPGSGSSNPTPTRLTVMGDTLYFVATAPGTGLSPQDPAIPTLWETRGDVATTRPVGADQQPTRGSNPGPFAVMNGALYFTTFEEEETPKLWRSDGTAAGTRALADVGPKGLLAFDSLGLSHLTVLNDRLYFARYLDSLPGFVLGSTDGTPEGTTVVASHVTLTTAASYPIELPAFGGSLFFAGEDSTHGIELWKTDGTEAGTVLVKDIRPGSGASSSPYRFTPLGDALYFLVRDSTTGTELWRTDGTDAGTWRVVDIRNNAGQASIATLGPVLNGYLYFVAEDATTGAELWRTNGTDTMQVMDIQPGPGSSSPSYFQVLGNVLYFSAYTAETGFELWRTEGTQENTWRVQDLNPGTGSSSPASLTVLGDTLYFIAATPDTGTELWRTDGTGPGTTRVADVWPGSGSGVLAESLFALPTEQVLLFAANDGVNGTELWRSDGTEAGTVLLQDLVPGQLGSEPDSFTLFGDSIVFGANDGRHGREPWSMPRALLTNTTPPSITCPADPLIEAQQFLGARVSFPAAEATDDTGLPPSVSYSHEPGGLFPLGDTVVTATARDAAGLVATCTFTVKVRDTTPPAPTCPTDATVEATSPSGAVVSFSAPFAIDTVTREPNLTVSPASGSVFAQGDTPVTVTATDQAGNSNQCTFTVHVRDTTASVVTCPANPIVEAEDASGTSVSWPPATATDATSYPTLTYDHANGSHFPLGSTPVTVTAKDGAGNLSSCTFQVLVRDTKAPSLQCPAALQLEATGPSGAQAEYTLPDAVDTVSAVTMSTSHASGSTFPVGVTSVRVRAEDSSDNATECLFSVAVLDTLPPLLMCPQEVRVTSRSKGPVAVELPRPSVTDRVTTSPSLTLSPESGGLFQPGDTPVEVTAMDAAGNTARCSFNVHVEQIAGGCATVPGGTSSTGWLGLLSLLALAARRRAPSSSRGP